ncbi:MAG: hypothetical protein COX62_05045 [Deltaproteobacteria bacterium CG_4_10_14_0_2_um_filter_43_8]|nr:MAG: hypothetical protein COV43_05545 [Deltaproteobacteria bacterium CG11_big_fil_rev_8_21_14_0_20_42_23]PJA20274.1 MAG: hypothetical protein COX62_05045 [Deltaproteobacteria bacterium CG_4_10_14_0_2_um_filter_43_8]PJC64056.1 MAG: hypothetical protein CO021_06520 [Deltaproteobacteria bacterium CG_4_9_14_0_2_um_filter_42_21]
MNKKYEKLSQEKLEALIHHHNDLYFQEHAPEISDYEFDQLVETLRKRFPQSKVFETLPSDVKVASKKVEHTSPMLSLDKCYDEETLAKWASKCEGKIIAMPKIDGCAVSIHYDEKGKLHLAATRGNGVFGEDITENALHIHDVPKKISLHNIEVRGEIFMPLSVFKRYQDQFANPRNLAAGAIKLKDAKKTEAYNLSFFAYDLLGANVKTEHEKRELLKQHKFPQVETRLCDREHLREPFDYFVEKRNKSDFETDGVVYRADLLSEQERLGSTAHHPRFAIAYKFQGETGITELEGIEWSVARTGTITPVALVKPVLLSGVTVRRASLHNVGLMEKLGLKERSTLVMMRRGDVIPHVESVVKASGKAIAVPEKCPACDAPTKREEDFLYCTNSENCVRQKVAELEHFVKAAEIDGFGGKLLEKLYEEGLVTEASDFYQLTLDQLLELDRMGETLATKLLRNIEEKKTLPEATVILALGLKEVGKRMAKTLASLGSLEDLRQMNEEELAQVEGIGPVIAHNVVSGLKEKKHSLARLLKYVSVEKTKKKQSGKVAGKSFLFTGKMLEMSRKEAEDLVQAEGGEVLSGVSSALQFLVVGDGGGAGSKLDKAKALQAKGAELNILDEKQFLKLVK